ncbi:hypothetical protein Patl1_11366 [Pistacia atlantica]|uniref:Uncharacterized protein n=1 Tax=Pistacia atlantica TaxID=434234 RepID=A0ACC1A6R5_9ROSI|nr:hypothetical protein Patl1_11366 [Pistacia atlantica]
MEEREKQSTKEASEEVSQEFKTLIKAEDLNSLKQLQYLILGRLQDSNAVLSHFNEYSEHCFDEVSGDFSRNARLLKSMKGDLDYIFQKLSHRHFWEMVNRRKRTCIDDIKLGIPEKQGGMKAKILATYPDAFPDESTREALDQRPDLELPQ